MKRALDEPECGPGFAGRRGELGFALVLAAAIIALALGDGKFYPFSPPSFFLASVHRYCIYVISDPDGHSLPLHEFGLGEFFFGQGGNFDRMPKQEPGAIKLPPTNNIHGLVLPGEKLVAIVRDGLRAHPDLPSVGVEQRVIGPIEGGGVGVVSVRRWRVTRTTAVVEGGTP